MQLDCPYCQREHELDLTDFEPDTPEQYECSCGFVFMYSGCITIDLTIWKAECLNGGFHNWKASETYPLEHSRMVCKDCDEHRDPTDIEWLAILGCPKRH